MNVASFRAAVWPCALWAFHAAAAQDLRTCAGLAATTPPAGAPIVELHAPAGQALYAPPGVARDDIGAGGVCVAVFDRARGSLLLRDTTDPNGLFTIRALPPGEYIVVVGAPTLHAAVQPVRVPAARRDAGEPRLLVHLRDAHDARPSLVSLVTSPALRRELLDRYAADQGVRRELIAHGADHPDSAVLSRMDSVDAGNEARMRVVVRQLGWPGRGLVGMDGSEAAFILVQHAGLAFQREMLPLVEAAFRNGDLTGQDFALLTDRVLVRDGKPQRYGTQALPIDRWVNRQPLLQPIEDSLNVDRRRAELGMPPLAEYLEFLRRFYLPSPPAGRDVALSGAFVHASPGARPSLMRPRAATPPRRRALAHHPATSAPLRVSNSLHGFTSTNPPAR